MTRENKFKRLIGGIDSGKKKLRNADLGQMICLYYLINFTTLLKLIIHIISIEYNKRVIYKLTLREK